MTLAFQANNSGSNPDRCTYFFKQTSKNSIDTFERFLQVQQNLSEKTVQLHIFDIEDFLKSVNFHYHHDYDKIESLIFSEDNILFDQTIWPGFVIQRKKSKVFS